MTHAPVITFASQKGGAGKSSLSAALAWELQRRHGPVLVVDMDSRQRSLLKNYALALEAGLEAKVTKTVELGLDLYKPEVLPTIAKDYSAVVIDTPGWSGEPQRAAMLASDLVLVPVIFDGMNTLAIEDTLDTLGQARKLKRSLRAAIVINQQLSRTELSEQARKVLQATGLPILRTEVFVRNSWRRASSAHLPLGAYDPWSRAAREVRSLTDDVERFIRKWKGS